MHEKTVVIFSTRYIDYKDSYLFAKSDYFEKAMAKLLELDYFKKTASERCGDYWQRIVDIGLKPTYQEICQKIQIENAELKGKIIDCLLSPYIE